MRLRQAVKILKQGRARTYAEIYSWVQIEAANARVIKALRKRQTPDGRRTPNGSPIAPKAFYSWEEWP